MLHIPVMPKETIKLFSYLKDIVNPVIVDCTFGLGGHSKLLLEKFQTLKIIALEIDNSILESQEVKELKKKFNKRLIIQKASYVNLNKFTQGENISGMLIDLGVSSPQIDNPERGFSYSHNSLLDMRMSLDSNKVTAEQLINTASEIELRNLIYRNSSDRFAPLIAKRIVEKRQKSKITNSEEIVQLIEKEFKGPKKKALKHIKCFFQSIRIEVNNELDNLKKLLKKVQEKDIVVHGFIVFITYHSIENRLVKEALKPTKTIRASYDEIKGNKRASSARIRYCKVP